MRLGLLGARWGRGVRRCARTKEGGSGRAALRGHPRGRGQMQNETEVGEDLVSFCRERGAVLRLATGEGFFDFF